MSYLRDSILEKAASSLRETGHVSEAVSIDMLREVLHDLPGVTSDLETAMATKLREMPKQKRLAGKR